jgi:hypothetical protein
MVDRGAVVAAMLLSALSGAVVGFLLGLLVFAWLF